MRIIPENIPAELRGKDRWVVWKYEEREGKWTKVPYSARTGAPTAASEKWRASWTTFAAAGGRFEGGGWDGIGFVLAAEDDILGVDLDRCRDPETGELAAWAASIVEELSSYTEVTPSGTGVHILCHGKLPPGDRRKDGVEMYEEGRYFTVTGDRLASLPENLRERTSVVAELHGRIFKTKAPETPRRNGGSAGPDAEAVLQKLFVHPKYSALWHGDTSGYDSQSEADLALCGYIAFLTGPDFFLIDSLFRQSALMREKWTSPGHGRAGSTYGADTINAALDGKTEFFDWRRPAKFREPALNSLSALNSSDAISPPEAEWPADLAPEAFHGPAGEIALALAPETEADPAALLLNLLVTFGNAVGRGPHMKVLTSHHGANLFAALVGKTGEGSKGSSWDPVRYLFERALPGYAGEKIVGGLASGEGLVSLVRDRVEKRVGIKDKKTGRMTGEFETVIEDEGVPDKRALIVESELSALLKIMNRPGNVLSEQLRKAWDNGDLQNLSKNSPLKATGAHISLMGHITPEALRLHLTEADSANGFANRFLWMLCRRSQYLPEGGNIPYLNNYITSIHKLVELASDKIMAVARQPSTKAMWAAVYPDLRREGVGMFGELTARRAPIVARLSLIYSLWDGAGGIAPAHLLAALAVWERGEASVRFLFGDTSGDPTADALYEAMAARPEGATRTDLHAALGRNRPVADIDRALTGLQRAGRARMQRQKGEGGREVEAWYSLAVARDGKAAVSYLEKAKAVYESNELNENSAEEEAGS